MRAIVYTRVSSDTGGYGRSVTEQERECREHCERQGWPVAEVLCDNDVGASRFSTGTRDAFARLDEVLQPGDVLVTWEASRATRDLLTYAQLRDLCADRGVKWCYSGALYDLNNDTDRLKTGLDALIAEQEAAKIRARVLRASRSRAAEGKPHGRPPFGYRRLIDPTDGSTTGWGPDGERADIVREIYRRFLTGEPTRTIVRDLKDRGVAAGAYRGRDSVWTPTRVRKILRNPSYSGLRVHQGKIVGPGQWSPLVDESDYLRATAILTDPERAIYSGHMPEHLLSGIARCGVCGEGMRALGDRPGRSASYRCVDAHLRRNKTRTDELVTEVVLARLDDPELRAAMSVEPKAVDGPDTAAELRERLLGFVDAAADGRLSPAALAQIENKLLPQIEAAKKRARPKNPALADLLSHDDVRARWDELGLIAKREIVSLLLTPVILPGASKVFDPSLIRIDWK